jgi:hypothetical protein
MNVNPDFGCYGDGLVADQLEDVLDGGALGVDDLAILADLGVFLDALVEDVDALAVDLLDLGGLLFEALLEFAGFVADARGWPVFLGFGGSWWVAGGFWWVSGGFFLGSSWNAAGCSPWDADVWPEAHG